MLPDVRAVIAAVIAAVGLLMISFGLIATFRVAQDNRAGALQANLAERGRGPVPSNEPRAILIIDTPAPPEPSAVPVKARIVPVLETQEAPPTPVVLVAPQSKPPAPPPEPPVGGPFQTAAVEPPNDAAAELASRSIENATEKSAEKVAAKRARAARIARERKARRAAQARRAKENVLQPFGNASGQ